MADVQHDLRIALLGPLVVEVRGQPVDVPVGHQRRLLAALALDAGRAVSTDRLVDLLWGDDPPASARNSLQSHLARLRRTLGGSATIQLEPPGYRLAAPADAVDVLRFDRLVDAAAGADDLADRRGLLDRALSLWRAEEPLALDANGLTEDARRVRRRRHATQLERAATALAAGDTATAEADARAVLLADPLHEPAAVLLVRVLAAAGRTAEADATVQRFRDRLADELGLDPSPALDGVHTALLRGELAATDAAGQPPGVPQATSGVDPAVGAAAAAAVDPSAASDRASGSAAAAVTVDRTTRPTLPRSSFRGRREALDALAGAVAARWCVTVVGPGGVGKTRLALELVHSGPRRVVWADLLDSRTRGDVLGRLAVAAGCGTPTDLATLSPLAEELTGREMLVVLDNCEQAVDEVAAVVDALVQATDAAVLATSRTPLGVAGEREFDLAPLPTRSPDGSSPPALALFADRVGRSLDLDDPIARRAATDVVEALDGLPLALELAARQARNLGVEAVRDRLDDRLELLGTPRPAGHPAHSDLRSLVRWSTDQLDEPDRRAFRWLSVFSGTFTLEQAEEQLGGDRANVPAGAASVARLVENSLVERRPPDRFLLLETLRMCGAEELEEAGEATDARARHTEVVLAAVEAAAALIGTAQDVAGVAALNALVADLQTVTDRLVTGHDVEGLCRLACAVREYSYETQRPELLRAARVAVGLLDDGAGTSLPQTLRDGAAVAAAVEATARGDLDRARTLVDPVVAADRPSPATAAAWNLLGDTRLWGVDRRAEDAYREAVRLGEEADDAVGAATGLVGVALARAYVGDVTAARRTVDQLERRAELLGSPLVSAWAAYARAEAEADHDPEAALVAFELAIDRGRLVGGHLVIAAASSGAAAVRARHGDPATVLPHVREALQDLRRSGNATVQQGVLRNVSVLLTRMGSDDAAAILLGAASSSSLYEAERRRVEVATRALTERLGDDVVRRRRAEGERMSPGEVVDVALTAIERLIDV